MTFGDRISQISQNIFFPIINIRDRNIDQTGMKLYTAPNGMKCLYRNKSLDKMIIWEQWRWKEYDNISIKPDNIILEIGAHIGTSTLQYAKESPFGIVYSIEALPENYKILKQNIVLNKLTNVKAFQLAIIGDKNIKNINLNFNPYNSGGHSLYNDTMPTNKQINVPAKTLLQFIEDLNIKKIDALHIDVEGAEYEILLSTPSKIISSIPQIILEYHDKLQTKYKYTELLEYLQKLGYKTKVYHSNISKILNLGTGIICAVKKDF